MLKETLKWSKSQKNSTHWKEILQIVLGGGFNKGKHETIDLTTLASQLTKPQNSNNKTTVQLNSECGPQGQGHVYRKTMENSCHT